MSLFGKIPLSRTCEDAKVPVPFCVCNNHTVVNITQNVIKEASLKTVEYINGLLTNYTDVCSHLSLNNTLLALKTEHKAGIYYTDYLVMVKTSPGGGQFDTEVRHHLMSDTMTVEGPISRTNMYLDTAWCVDSSEMRNYCYCKKQLS